MGAVDALLELPAVPAILEQLVNAPEGVEERALFALPSGEASVRRAIGLLLDAAMITREGPRLLVRRDDTAMAAVTGLLNVFRRLTTMTSLSLIFRGLLNATQGYRCLTHRETLKAMLVGEGYDAADVERTLRAEDGSGYLDRITIQYRMIGRVRERFFPFIPYHHYHDFIFMNSRHTRDPGAVFSEEEYLLGKYPPALGEQGRRYALAEKPHLVEKIAGESFDIIWWYDRY